MRSTFGLLACLALAFPMFVHAAPLAMPEEIPGIYVGMSMSELLKARPDLQAKLARDPEWKDRRNGVVLDRITNAKLFDTAIYMFEEDKLAAISFYMTRADAKRMQTVRRGIYKTCVARWGKASRKDIGTMEPKSKTPRLKTPAAIWERPEGDVHLLMPEARTTKEPRAILMLVGSESRAKLAPGFQKEAVGDQEAIEALRSAGLADD